MTWEINDDVRYRADAENNVRWKVALSNIETFFETTLTGSQFFMGQLDVGILWKCAMSAVLAAY